ncbi:MAG: hypothetical protein LUQ22_01060, partial [Methanotrichaceae archaeon]|nr:hypothetical protein [Methanotrichaceae archaeon]
EAFDAFDKAVKLDPSYDVALQNKRSVQENSLGSPSAADLGSPSAADAILNDGSEEAYQMRLNQLGFNDPNSIFL